MLALPNQEPGLIEAVGLTRVEVDAAAWTVDRDGVRLGGAAAANRVLDELGGCWRSLSWPYRVPGLKQLEEAAYRWVAANRSRL